MRSDYWQVTCISSCFGDRQQKDILGFLGLGFSLLLLFCMFLSAAPKLCSQALKSKFITNRFKSLFVMLIARFHCFLTEFRLSLMLLIWTISIHHSLPFNFCLVVKSWWILIFFCRTCSVDILSTVVFILAVNLLRLTSDCVIFCALQQVFPWLASGICLVNFENLYVLLNFPQLLHLGNSTYRLLVNLAVISVRLVFVLLGLSSPSRTASDVFFSFVAFPYRQLSFHEVASRSRYTAKPN